MRSRGKNECKKAWKKWEAEYAKKEGGKEEAARERREFYCDNGCLLYTSPSPRDRTRSRMPSSA